MLFNSKGQVNRAVIGIIILVVVVALLILFYTNQFEKITNMIVGVEEQVIADVPT